MKILPIGNRVAVKVDGAGEQTQNGIIIPDTAQEAPRTGTVMAIGQLNDDAHVFEENDRISFKPRAGYVVEHDGDKLLVLDLDDILCVLLPE